MIDRYTSLSDIIAESPTAANILMSYGISSYDITENQFSSLEEITTKYGVDANSIISQINCGMAHLY